MNHDSVQNWFKRVICAYMKWICRTIYFRHRNQTLLVLEGIPLKHIGYKLIWACSRLHMTSVVAIVIRVSSPLIYTQTSQESLIVGVVLKKTHFPLKLLLFLLVNFSFFLGNVDISMELSRWNFRGVSQILDPVMESYITLVIGMLKWSGEVFVQICSVMDFTTKLMEGQLDASWSVIHCTRDQMAQMQTTWTSYLLSPCRSLCSERVYLRVNSVPGILLSHAVQFRVFCCPLRLVDDCLLHNKIFMSLSLLIVISNTWS